MIGDLGELLKKLLSLIINNDYYHFIPRCLVFAVADILDYHTELQDCHIGPSALNVKVYLRKIMH